MASIRSHILFLMFLLGKVKVSLALATSSSSCNIPSQFWCDNPEIAMDCGVTEQCKNLKQSNSKLVDFTLYYESMCPDCQNFYKSQLGSAYKKVGSIMNLTLVPYGNAETHADQSSPYKYRFECQHGKEECIGNMIETCAIDIYKNISIYFPFINCIEIASDIPRKSAVQCASEYKLDVAKIMACVNSYKGHLLEYEMGVKTQALRPQHQYVPWVTLNGVHTDKIQNQAQKDLVKLICTTYTGYPKPPACSA